MKTKLTKKDKINILNRYSTKKEEYLKLTSEELKNIFQNTKLSSTDRQAIIDATSEVLYREKMQVLKDTTEAIKNEEIPAKFNVDEGEE